MIFVHCRRLTIVGSVEIDIGRLQADVVTVDALARLQLAARRSDCDLTLHGASPEFRELVDFMGLGDVLVVEPQR